MSARRCSSRGKRPLQPTELCLALAGEGRKVHQAGRESAELLTRFRQGRAGAVRVGGTPVFLDGVISGMIAAFQNEHPDVRIDQSYGYAAEIAPKVKDGVLDLAILPMRRSTIPDGLDFEQILPGRNVIACGAGHPLTRSRTVKLQEIAHYPWIAPPIDSPLYHDLRAVLDGIGVRDIKISFSGGSLSAVVSILSGFGRSDGIAVFSGLHDASPQARERVTRTDRRS